VLRAGSLEVTVRALHVSRNLSFQLLDRAELPLVAKTIQKTHAHYIAVKIAVPVQYEGLN
jgi:hypothetical protein